MKKIAIFITTIFLVFSGVLATPVDFASAQTLPQNAGNASIEEGLKGGCKIWDSSVSICFLSIIYDYVLGVSFMIVGLVANLFDFFLGYTLNSDAYRSDFIIKGWGVIRDISNVAFIFTLLYLAIRHILGMSAKKYIPTLVIVALLLNFSLFFTRVVIDGGNILARAFYNSMVIEGSPNADPNIKNISVAIVAKINPQQLLNEAMFAQELTTGDYSTANGGVITSSTTTQPYVAKNLSDNVGYYATIFILLAAVNFILAWVFFSVMLLMVGRTVGLWFAMIFSPIAFITLAVPGSAGLVKQLSFDSWKDTVLKLSFLAPIFIFFLYLIITFLTIIFSTPVPMENRDTFMKLMAVFIPFAFVITLLFIAKKTATDMAGEIGGTIKNIVGKAAGILGGAALGATAFAGRATIGRLASKGLKDGKYNERIKNATGLNKFRLIQERAALKKITDSSLDIRNAGKAKGVVGWASRGVGAGFNSGMTGFGGKDFNVGKGSDQSRKKFEDEKDKRDQDLAKELEKIDRNEDLSILNRMLNEDGFDAQEDMVTHLDQTLQNLENPAWVTRVFGPLTAEQREAKIANYQGLRSAIQVSENKEDLDKAIKEGTTKNATRDANGNVRTDNDGNIIYEQVRTHDGIKAEKETRRNTFAKTVQNDPWLKVQVGSGNAEVTADKIRKPEDSKEKKIAKLLKDDDNSGGGGNNPPSGGGGANNPPPGGGGGNNPPSGGPTRGPGGGSAGAGTI